MRGFAVLIPAYRPKWSLPQYVNGLLKNEIAHVIIIDDGNDSDYEALFQQFVEFERCTVLTHSKNQGKGAGLKTGFRYFLKHFSELSGIVTADADGQHLIQDVLNIGERLVNRKGVFVLGNSNFDRKKYLLEVSLVILLLVASFAYCLECTYKILNKETNKHLTFVLIFSDSKDKVIRIGKEVKFTGEQQFNQEREKIAQKIRKELNQLAQK